MPIDYSKWKDIEVGGTDYLVLFSLPLVSQISRNSCQYHDNLNTLPLQISDDEDDTHPNIDTPSLFRWRHEARVNRMGEFEQKKSENKEHLQK